MGANSGPLRRGLASGLATILVLLANVGVGEAVAQQTGGEVERVLSAILRVKAKVPRDARSAATLGAEREGGAVVVRDGYAVTIGYLVVEADAIEVSTADGRSVPAVLAGYDHASGFAVLRMLAPLAARPLVLGDSAALGEQEPVLVASRGDRESVALVRIASRREFAGGWEYLLDSAIFTSPAIPDWSGAALIGSRGELLGIGSLIVADAEGSGGRAPGNMFVPVDLLRPALDDLIAHGRAPGAARPWLGVNTEEVRGRLVVTRVSPDGPAARAGVREGDLVLGVSGKAVSSLADFYRALWGVGPAGVTVALTLLQGMQVRMIEVVSIERSAHFMRRPVH